MKAIVEKTEAKFTGIFKKTFSMKRKNGINVIPKTIENKNLSIESISLFLGNNASAIKKPETKNNAIP